MKGKMLITMSLRPLLLLMAVFTLVLFGADRAQAVPITIANSGFETPTLDDNGVVYGISGWTVVGSAGVWNPSTIRYPGEAPEGTNVAWINDGGIYQVLGVPLEAGMIYTLEVDVGHRADHSFPGAEISLWAGDTLLESLVTPTPDPGEFLTSTLTYTALSDDPDLLKIAICRLSPFGQFIQLNVDNVSLDASMPSPEPSTMLLFGSGLLGLGLFGRKRFRK